MGDELNGSTYLSDVVQNPIEEGIYIPPTTQAAALLQAVQIINEYEVLRAKWEAIPWDLVLEVSKSASGYGWEEYGRLPDADIKRLCFWLDANAPVTNA